MTEKRGNVIPFVDAATLAMRKEAVRRVREKGIFRLPPGLDGYDDGSDPEGKRR